MADEVSRMKALGKCQGVGTGPAWPTFSRMDRFFLAVMVSGLLLAAAAVCLFVATSGGERTVSVMNLPAPSDTGGLRRLGEDQRALRDDPRR